MNQVENLLFFAPSLLIGETLEVATPLKKSARTSTLNFSQGCHRWLSKQSPYRWRSLHHRVGSCWMGIVSLLSDSDLIIQMTIPWLAEGLSAPLVLLKGCRFDGKSENELKGSKACRA